MDALLVLQSSTAIALCVAAYFAGSIPFGLILALTVARKDVRAAGSGNIGATNVARVVGKKLGALTLVLDAVKAIVPVVVAWNIALPTEHEAHRALLASTVGLCALVGHCFPVWLKFKGGKGVATGLGVLLAWHPELALYGLVAFAVVYGASRMVSLGSLMAGVAVGVAIAVRGPADISAVPLALCFAIILVRHTENIQRMLHKKELKV